MPFSLLLLFFITIVRAHKLTSTSLEREFSEKNLQKINHFQQLIREWTDKLNGNQIKQMDSLIKSMLVTECQISEKYSKNEIVLGAEHGCQSLPKGEILSDGTELVEKVTMAFQTDGQNLIESLKRKEFEAKNAVDGGTLAEILPLTKVGNILRMLEAKMSAGPAKEAVQNVLAHNSVVMPSAMVQLVMNLWLLVFNREKGNADYMLQRQQIQQSRLQSFKCCSSSVPGTQNLKICWV
uniref:Uncharacterized protein n=1 Tax=Globodera rostochiensis TaxID=31243 RepID=A0A914H6U4_GLORO